MKHQKENGFADRRKSSAEAKMRLLEKFESAPKPDDPVMLAKRAELAAISVAREERRAERERLKQEISDCQKAEAAALKDAEAKAIAEADAKLKAEAEAAKESQKKLVELVIANEAVRKAERDRRYAARKARQR